ncbi:MAG: hypothetical protein ABIJ18_00670 [archaeon]
MNKIKFSKIEIRDLIKAWLAISVAFALIFTPGRLDTLLTTNITIFATNLVLSAITVGSAFLLHELGHKFVAQHYGCYAEFRADNFMLFLALVMAIVLKIVFAAPGAVMIGGRISKERNGKISMAGPATNLILAILFLIPALIFSQGFLGILFHLGFLVNVWIGLFNLIPLWVLDGKKILSWNKLVYFTMLAIGIFLFIINYFLPLQPLF